MIIARRYLDRRTVVRGLGTALALPLLDAMVPALTAEARTAAAPAARWAIFYAPNGMAMQFWTPAGVGLDPALPRILSPLERWRDRLLVLSGLADLPGNPRPEEGGGDHARASGTFLTGVHCRKTVGSPQAGVSADQIAARTLGRETQFASLEIGVEAAQLAGLCDSGYNCTYVSTISWADERTPLPPEHNPRLLFDRLFADALLSPAERRARVRDDRSVLDAVTTKIAALIRELGGTDRRRLDQYLDAVRDVERRIQRVEAHHRTEPLPDVPAAVPTNFAEHARALMDLLALAFEADLTRVATFMIGREGTGRPYPEIGVSDAHHPLSHHQYDPAAIDRLRQINQYHVEQFAYFVERLASVREAGRSLLDTSVLMYGAGLSDSHAHAHVDLPVALVTGSATGLSGARHVEYPSRTPISNLYVSVLGALGVRGETFGDSTGELAGLRA